MYIELEIHSDKTNFFVQVCTYDDAEWHFNNSHVLHAYIVDALGVRFDITNRFINK